MSQRYVKWFKEIGIEDVAQVGGKNASLGEMYQNLTAQGVLVPNGFAVTAKAYADTLTHNDAWKALHQALDDLDCDDVLQLQQKGKACRDIVMACELPKELETEILAGYDTLQKEYPDALSLAVRSSATAEDSPEASFAGQNETYLNISSKEALLHAYKACIASNFTDRSLYYKKVNNFDYFDVLISVVIMKMVRSDLASSGVMFSIDTESGFKDVVFINAAYGLGENVVQGAIDPDSFYVHKPTFSKGFRTVLKRRLGKKQQKMIFTDTLHKSNLASQYTKNIPTTKEEQTHFCLSDEDVLILADYAIKVEAHYSKKAGYTKPMDMEWAKDGLDGKLYMVQARPETVKSRENSSTLQMYHLTQKGKILVEGRAVGEKIAQGKVRIIKDSSKLHTFKKGKVLVAETTSPDWEPVMQEAAAIITSRGGRTCHAAIVAREMGIPAIVGADNATEILKDGMEVTVSCAEGESGHVYEGKIPYEITTTDLHKLPKTKTKLMMNLGNPQLAFSLSSLPTDGIGLARMEFIINTYIKAHPMALIYPEKVDKKNQDTLQALTRAYEDMQTFFI